MTKATLLKRLQAAQASLAKERDKLRDLRDEAEDLLELLERGSSALDECIDALSGLV